jgi:hypothetical protein
MAWSKIKTTITGLAIALLGIGVTAAIVDALLPTPDIQGTWEGTLNLPGYGLHRWEPPKTRLILRIVETNGGYQASLDKIDLGHPDIVLDTFTYEYPYLHGKITSTNDDFSFFTGKVNRFGEKITLKSWDNNYYSQVVFRRTTHPTPFPEALTDDEFAPRAGSALQGFWVGKIGRGKGAIRIQVKIGEAADGTYRADFYAPDQGTNRLPTAVSYVGGTVKLTLTAGYGMFEGWLRNGGKGIVGNWIQNDRRTTTTLTQADYSEYEAQGAK